MKKYYVCSPLSAETKKLVERNRRAAVCYMDIISRMNQVDAVAPHAYLPFILHDENEEERNLAINFDFEIVKMSEGMYVCGNRLSDGMEAEVALANKIGITVNVFNMAVYDEIIKKGYQAVYMKPDDTHKERYALLSASADNLKERGFIHDSKF